MRRRVLRRNITITIRNPTENYPPKGKMVMVVMSLGSITSTKARETGIIGLTGGGPLMRKIVTLKEAKEALETGKITLMSIKGSANATRTILLITEIFLGNHSFFRLFLLGRGFWLSMLQTRVSIVYSMKRA